MHSWDLPDSGGRLPGAAADADIKEKRRAGYPERLGNGTAQCGRRLMAAIRYGHASRHDLMTGRQIWRRFRRRATGRFTATSVGDRKNLCRGTGSVTIAMVAAGHRGGL
ncbi:hypothetical protein KCP77_12760 [Salmonella enterica subsp. enterica]|nr:hypothetical protein KCP77_12760 [Salmonella enterica subsp. enterica]